MKFSEKLAKVIELVQQNRRYLNNILLDLHTGSQTVKNSEDLLRAVGELNAAYRHLKTAQAVWDQEDKLEQATFCIYKHLATAIVHIEEIDESTSLVYEAIGILSDGKIMACGACDADMDDSVVILTKEKQPS